MGITIFLFRCKRCGYISFPTLIKAIALREKKVHNEWCSKPREWVDKGERKECYDAPKQVYV